VKSTGAAFALGAHGRLLPLSIPMRFFGAAALFHVFAWLALGIGAAQVPRFVGGAGWPLAALHAATLGVLAMSAIGASLQLMPVATLQPLGSWRVPVIVWWLYTPGVALLVAGMAAQRPAWIAVAAVPVIAALLIYAALLARNLAGARGMPGVRAQGWLALGALVVALASAGAMVASWSGWAIGWPRNGLLMLHIAGAVFGFMGLLALGLSNVLLPMFALGPVPGDRTQLAVATLCAAALLACVPVALAAWPRAALLAPIALAAVAVALHLRSMRAVWRAGMRSDGGGSLRLMQLGWAGLCISLVLVAAWALGGGEDRGVAVGVVVCAVAGWLMSFLFGVLQRIVPFLASMHLAGTSRRAPTPSSLTDEAALGVHRHAHVAALALLALGLGFDSAWAVTAAAAAGVTGAGAFVQFVARTLLRARAARRAAAKPATR
jgi:hypothetical protein